MAEVGPKPVEVHKALADDTRFRLYRYLGLSGGPVSVRELSTRLSLHPNTLRSHLRRLEEAEGRDYRLLAEILAGLLTGKRSLERAETLTMEWGQYLVTQGGPKPGTRLPARRNLGVLQEAMARAGFDPRFHRRGGQTVEVSLRDCPFRDLAEDHRELACSIHRGLLAGMLRGLKPPLRLQEFSPFVERSVCRVIARGSGV
jgi:predicted ArsR family transcriptional regulator